MLAVALLVVGCTGERVGDDEPERAALIQEFADTDPDDPDALGLAAALLPALVDGDHGDLVPPADRVALAEALSLFIADINRLFALGVAGSPTPTERGAWSGDANSEAVAASQLAAILADLGKDPQATGVMMAAQAAHSILALEYHLADQTRTVADRTASVTALAASHAEVSTSLSKGALGESATVGNAAAMLADLRQEARSVRALVGDAGEAADPEPEDLTSEPSHTLLRELSERERDAIITQVRFEGRAAMALLVTVPIYALVPVDDPQHESFLPNLTPALFNAKQQSREWTSEDWRLWDDYLGETPSLGVMAADAMQGYESRLLR